MVGFSETIEKNSLINHRSSQLPETGLDLFSWRGKRYFCPTGWGKGWFCPTTAGKEFYPPGGERTSFAQLERERTSFAQLAGKG